ncbi:phage major capsid protein [Candidatus Poribacteria bacterium]|nr:phage major capsid protein [Candidatus Poribacteria bacterium]
MNKHQIPRNAFRGSNTIPNHVFREGGKAALDHAIENRLLIETPMAIRADDIKENDNRTVEVVFSAGAEYRQWWGREKLDVSGCRLDRLKMPYAPVLLNHNRDLVVGTVESAEVGTEEARASLRFSKSPKGEEVYQDILDKILGQISNGYRILKYEIDETNPKDPLYIIKEWEPFEISIVAYAADPGASVRDGYLNPLQPNPDDSGGENLPPVPEGENREETDMDPKELLKIAKDAGLPELGMRAIENDWSKETLEAVIANEQARSAEPTSDPPPEGDPLPEGERGGEPESDPEGGKPPESGERGGNPGASDPPPEGERGGEEGGDPEGAEADKTRVTRIYEIGAEHGERDMAMEAITDPNCSIEVFQQRILEKQKRVKELAQAERRIPERITIDPKDQANFRISDLLYSLANGKTTKRGGKELEICEEETALRTKLGIQTEGTPIPQQIFSDHGLYTANRALYLAHRILEAGTDTKGGHTIDDELLADSFIDILLEYTVATQLVTRMDDLQGNITFPRQDARAVAQFVGEVQAATEQNPTFEIVTMSPKHLRAWTEVSTTLLHQSSISVENFIRRDLARAIAKAMDQAILTGTGTNNQPTGIESLGSKLNSVKWPADASDETSFDYDSVLNCEEQLANDDALMGRLAWVADPKVRRYGRKTAELGSGTSRPIWQNNMMCDYPAYVTTQCAAETAYLANWSEMILGCWGGLDVMYNPYSKDKEGIGRFTIGQMCDLAARHAQSFCHLTKTA